MFQNGSDERQICTSFEIFPNKNRLGMFDHELAGDGGGGALGLAFVPGLGRINKFNLGNRQNIVYV